MTFDSTTFALACMRPSHRRHTLLCLLSPGQDSTLGPRKRAPPTLRERKDAVYENLRDLNFEYKAGKVPDIDYAVAESFPAGRSRHHSWPRSPASKPKPPRNPRKARS